MRRLSKCGTPATAIAPDQHNFAIANGDILALYVRTVPDPIATIEMPDHGSIMSVAWSCDSRLLAVVPRLHSNDCGPPRIYDAATGRLLVKCTPGTSPRLAFDASGTRLIGFAGLGWQVWEASTGERLDGRGPTRLNRYSVVGVSSPS
jgi:hypothetical protein